MSEDEFADALTALSGLLVSAGAVRSWERRTHDPPGRVLWAALRLGGIDVLALMEPGMRTVGIGDSDETALAVESHKFIPVYCEPKIMAQLVERFPQRDQFGVAHGTVTPFHIHVFPFGVAVFHLVEQMEFAGIAWLAAWRRASYQTVRATVEAWIAGFSGGTATGATAKYVLSIFNILHHPWTPTTVETALRLVAMPGVLLPQSPRRAFSPDEMQSAYTLERELIQTGSSPDSDVVSFGVEGISHGYASWAGLAYHPLAAEQALGVTSLVPMEILTQALWCYSSHVIDAGSKPPCIGDQDIASHCARLLAPSGRESLQACRAREAVITTSRVRAMLDHAGTIYPSEKS